MARPINIAPLFHGFVLTMALAETAVAWILPVSSPIMSLPTIETSSWLDHQRRQKKEDVDLNSKDNGNDRTHDSASPVVDQSSSSVRQFEVFCDLDGVLVDFHKGIEDLGLETMPSYSISSRQDENIGSSKAELWEYIQSQSPSFFATLPWTNEGPLLWKALLQSEKVRQLDILTGVPPYASSKDEKMMWCEQNLGVPFLDHLDKACPIDIHQHELLSTSSIITTGTTQISSTTDDNNHHHRHDFDWDSKTIQKCRVITCWSVHKHYESGPGRVLIDDRIELKKDWEARGGIFIHHQLGNLEGTMEQLQHYGVITPTVPSMNSFSGGMNN